MNSKIYVITGNKAQYEEYIRQNTRKRWDNGDTSASYSDYVYVADTHTLRGLRNIHGVFVGNYRIRADLSDITSMLDIINERPYGYHMNLIEGKEHA
jgi:hypothetical protein